MARHAEDDRGRRAQKPRTAALEFTPSELEMLSGIFAELGVEVDDGNPDHMKNIAKEVRLLFEKGDAVSASKLGTIATRMDAARGNDSSMSEWPLAVPAENVKRSSDVMTSADSALLDMDSDDHGSRLPNPRTSPAALRHVQQAMMDKRRIVFHTDFYKFRPRQQATSIDTKVLRDFFTKAIDETPRVAYLSRFKEAFVDHEKLFVRTQWTRKPGHAADLVVRQGDKSWVLEVKIWRGQLNLRAEHGDWHVSESNWNDPDAGGLSQNLLKLFEGDPDCVRAAIETLQDGLEERV